VDLPMSTSKAAAPAADTQAGTSRHTPGLLVWGPAVGFGLLLLGLARHAGSGIGDPDTLWHVLAGRHLWETGSFAGPDPLSRSTTGPWVLNQWLPDLALALAAHVGGLPAVAWLTQALRVAVCLAVYVACRRVGGVLPAALVAAVAVLGAADSLSPRPQLVGFVLLAVTVSAWLRTAEDLRPRWWLLPVGWLWACSHGTWVVGVSIGAAVVLGLLVARALTRRDAVRLAVIPAGTVLLSAVTPVGPELFRSFATVRAVSPYIQEWRTPTLDSPSVLATLVLALLVPLGWWLRRETLRWPSAALWVVAVAWGATSMRTVAVAAIVLAPLAAAALTALIGRPRSAAARPERVVLVGSAIASLALSAVLAATGPTEPTGVPSRLSPRLDALTDGTVVWNTDLLGGWLMWSHPSLEHTADTRAELYGPQRARAYLAVLRTDPGWEATFDAARPGAALVEDGLPLVTALEARGWTTSGRDRGYVLLVPGR
jgi:hypothetical protein